MRRLASSLSVAVLVTLAAAAPVARAGAQGTSTFDNGDGRLKGPPVGLVSTAEMKSGEVQTIALVPGGLLTIEFPFPIARMDAGDDSLFIVSKFANKLTIKATTVRAQETRVNLTLGDADLTTLPFVFKVNPHAAPVQVLRYTDPVETELNRARARIAASEGQKVAQRVDALTEARLRQRLLLASPPVAVGREGVDGRGFSELRLHVETVQQIPGDGGTPQLYIRYRLDNNTPSAIEDLEFSATGVRTSGSVLGRTRTTPYYDLQDTRSASVVRGGSSVLGLLVMETPALAKGETLTITARVFGGRRSVSVSNVVAGPLSPSTR